MQDIIKQKKKILIGTKTIENQQYAKKKYYNNVTN